MTAEELRQGALDTFLRIADRFGVPCVILAILLYFGREAAIAVHGTVVEPMVKSHVEFLDTTAETLKEIGEVQRQQAATLQELSHGQNELRVIVKTIVSGSEPPAQN
jgi:hypothetical protein